MLDVARLLDGLLDAYGPQGWWPAEHAFEVMVGAVLVQRTSWTNAAKAVERLRSRGLLEPGALAKADLDALEGLVRPAGFYRAKASRLLRLARFVVSAGGLSALRSRETEELRHRLLTLDGIGEETADAILLYAFDRPVAVVDAYARRLFERVSGATKHYTDTQIRAAIAGAIKETARLNELHALVTEHGKRSCRKTPVCESCCLTSWCAYSRA